MKFLAPFALFTVASFMTMPLLAAQEADPLTGCAAKRQAISTQIEQAKTQGNGAQQAGLEKALSEVTANCTDASLKKERENKVFDAKHEVSRRQADLDKAMKKGDADKINKRKDKLAESRKALQDAVEELDQ
ncbi:DUF1090 domain-containing protein [Pseudomonas poae]|uniref:DUF1090 family protein n=1 Tax=Pseudomonas poae TaxID=200451 RepID=A0AAP2WHM2_9PSED|nr:DUF1090 domain-containing protein [Pseudomonas poae]KTC33465.1 hypothetical protein AO260_18425 [Pseudomonas sp. ABAC21]MCF5655593.1 DUF1090 family protein [Pseudomonas poae]